MAATSTSFDRSVIATAVLVAATLSGCCSNWMKSKQSVPAPCVGPHLLDQPRGSLKPIDYSLLRQERPEEHEIGPEDVLGIYIEGVLGRSEESPPVHFPQEGDLPPSIGYPVAVREDGMLSLPLVPPMPVSGFTLAQVEQMIKKAYTVTKQVLQPGRDRIIVTLMKPRTFHVIVIREDVGSTRLTGAARRPGEFVLEPEKRGQTYAIDLPAYENDVLHALSRTGGLPGADAKNEVLILRGAFRDKQGQQNVSQQLQDPSEVTNFVGAQSHVTRIPLQIGPCDSPLQITRSDIILSTGDIVVVQTRESEVFYTGGLLKGGQFPIPRDYDLDVLSAIAMAGGSVAAAAGGSGTVQGINLGGKSIFPPTRVTIVRVVGNRQFPIRVDLKRAVLDPKERVLIEPNDLVLLEYTGPELFGNILLNNTGVNFSLSGPIWK